MGAVLVANVRVYYQVVRSDSATVTTYATIWETVAKTLKRSTVPEEVHIYMLHTFSGICIIHMATLSSQVSMLLPRTM